MANNKKITVKAFEEARKATYNPIETFDWNGIEVTIKKTLSLKEMMEFVDGVVKSCFEKDTNAYIPEIQEFATKVCVLEKYANFTMPSNVESQYVLIYTTDIVKHVLNRINTEQFNEICDAISKKVKNLAQANIEAINRQVNELYVSFDNLQTKFSSLFEGISGDDIHAIAGALANGSFDEEKLVKSYINMKEAKAGVR